MKRLSGCVCLVTGGSGGIGYAIAERFGQEGATVIICSSSSERINAAAFSLKSSGVDVDAVKCDVTSKDDRSAMIQFISDKFGRIDVLVCNAGESTYSGRQMNITEEKYDK